MERDDFAESTAGTREEAMRRAKANAGNLGAYVKQRLLGILGSERKLIGANAAWQGLLFLAREIQRTYASWAEYANAWLDEIDQISDGRANASLDWWLHDPASPWKGIDWKTDLRDPPPIMRTDCPKCGQTRIRPWTAAYVYCDYCAALIDYDAELTRTTSAGPAYEQMVANLAPLVDEAYKARDIEAMTLLQRKLFDGWLNTCPSAVSVRVKQPDYRAKFVDYLAEAETIAIFDAEANRLRKEMQHAMTRLAIVGDRVPIKPFWMMVDAVLAHAERRDQLARTHNIYEMHPDGITGEQQQRIGWTMFAQAWTQLLDEGDREALLDRLNLTPTAPMVAAPQPMTWRPCSSCRQELAMFRGASRTVCDHCGDIATW